MPLVGTKLVVGGGSSGVGRAMMLAATAASQGREVARSILAFTIIDFTTGSIVCLDAAALVSGLIPSAREPARKEKPWHPTITAP
jgi:hypothetical protein